MKNNLLFLLLSVSVLAGCRMTGRLYPVQGPLSAQSPTPVLLAKLTGAFNSGNMTVVLADGEVCKGHWATVARPPVAKAGATASTAPDSNLSSVWDTIYGPGFYVSHVLGQRLYVQAVIPGNRRTVLKVEMYRSAGGEPNLHREIKGVAKDNKDNIYKLVF
jgi:hypothetical protein